MCNESRWFDSKTWSGGRVEGFQPARGEAVLVVVLDHLVRVHDDRDEQGEDDIDEQADEEVEVDSAAI